MSNYSVSYNIIKEWLPQTVDKLIHHINQSLVRKNLNGLNNNNNNKVSCTSIPPHFLNFEVHFTDKNRNGHNFINSIKNNIKLNSSVTSSIELFKKIIKNKDIESFLRVEYDNIIFRSKALNFESYNAQNSQKKCIKNKKIKNPTVHHKKSIIKLLNNVEKSVNDNGLFTIEHKKSNNLLIKSELSFFVNLFSFHKKSFYVKEFQLVGVYKNSEKNGIDNFIVACTNEDFNDRIYTICHFDNKSFTFKGIINKTLIEVMMLSANPEIELNNKNYSIYSKDEILKKYKDVFYGISPEKSVFKSYSKINVYNFSTNICLGSCLEPKDIKDTKDTKDIKDTLYFSSFGTDFITPCAGEQNIFELVI